jgi:preprotein translocase SecE subunit
VARDRQRAKQRRRRQAGSGPTGPARTRPRQADAEPREADVAPREADVEPREAGVAPREPDVEPTVEQEPASTVFPQRGDVQPVESDEPAVEFDETVEPAPDELDPAVREEAHERRGPRRSRGRLITFLGHVVDELRRVQWPDRRHVGQGTAVVLGFVVIAGAFLGLMDAIWKPLIEAIL